MYHYLAGITLLKSLSPYFRKHILTTIHSHELLFVQNFFITMIVLLFFVYKCFFDKEHNLDTMMKNVGNMKWTQLLCIFIISVLSVTSSVMIYEMDKKYNTPLMNMIFMRVGSTLALILIGVFLFKEKYTFSQIIGFLLIVVGIYLVSKKI
jgi:drug/metabolite transporter (DMT)-like permease